MASAGKGLPFIGKMNEFLNRILHPTVQKVGHSRAALDVIPRGYYLLNPVPAVPYTIEAGSTDNLVKVTGHNLRAGDIVRILTSANSIQEFEVSIDNIIDANNFQLAGYLSASLVAGDTFDALRAVIERLAPDGSSLTTIVTPPVSYNRKVGGITTQTSALEDLDTPANSRAVPVVLHGVDAANISITSNQLSIASSHVNDSMAIGNGVDKIMGITTNFEAQTHDADLLTNIGLKADVTAADDSGSYSIIAFIKRSLANWTTFQAKMPILTLVGSALKVDNSAVTQPVSGTVTANAGTNLNTSLLALETTQVANGVLVGAVTETAPANDTASSGLNGRLQRIAQNITSLIALLPVSLGIKAATGSLSIVPASDASFVTTDVSTAQLVVDVGAKADAVATTDTGTFSLIALIKRVAQNITSMSGKLPATLGITTATGSLSVAPASDAVFVNKPKALTSSFAEYLTLTTVQTFTAPANAIGGLIQAQDTNGANVRFKQGGTATTTSGLQLQPGRSEPIGSGSDVTVVSESGTNAVAIIWNIQA